MNGISTVRIGGCCPLVSELSRLGWPACHWAVAFRQLMGPSLHYFAHVFFLNLLMLAVVIA